MKKTTVLLIVLISILSTYGFSQEKYSVTATNGLLLREKPNANANKIGKLYFGAEVTILEKTENSQTINDNGTKITGNWVKIKFQNDPTFISNEDFGYVFDGYLKEKSIIYNEITQKLSKFPELSGYTINTNKLPFYLKGDFFGDEINDLVVLVNDNKGTTKIVIINYAKENKVHILGDENDPFNMNDYSWIGVFRKATKGEVLWSNYEGDFVDFKDVPENKKIRLPYSSLYMHASESCGGGFVYWKDGKFNWLQQE